MRHNRNDVAASLDLRTMLALSYL